MQTEPLTAREWWLICVARRRALEHVIDVSRSSGVPGVVVAQTLLAAVKNQEASPMAALRDEAEELLKAYKPPAGAEGGGG